jgi:PAS domain S-box-containing protein
MEKNNTEDQRFPENRKFASLAENGYRALFDSMSQGFCIVEVLFNELREPLDSRFLEVNRAFKEKTGLSDVIGKTWQELHPVDNQNLFRIYGDVVLSGKPAHFENHLSVLKSDVWYEVFAYPYGLSGSNQLAVLFNDITERKRYEQNQELLSDISQVLMDLDSIEETMTLVGRKIGTHFGVAWCIFAEIVNDFEVFTVSYGWNAAHVEPMKRSHQLKDFLTEEQLENYRAGKVMCVSDTQSDPIVNGASYGALGIRSLLTYPMVRDASWCFQISILDNQPRQWQDQEIELLKQLAGRIRARLEKARVEDALKKSEERQAFLLKLTDTMRPLSDPFEIQSEICRLVGKHLNVQRVTYAQVEADEIVVRGDYTDGIPSMAGRYPKGAFGPQVSDRLSETGTYFIADVANDADLTPFEKEAYAAFNIGAYMGVTIVKVGKLSAVFTVHNTVARNWSRDEISLMEEVAERTWSALERAHVEEALLQSEEKYRTLFDSMDEGFCIIQMLYDDAGKANDWRFLEVNRAFELNNGLRDAKGRTIREMTPDIEPKWMEIYDNVARTGKPLRFEESSDALKRVFSLYAFPIAHPDERKIAVIFADITERKNAEEMMKHSELRLHQLVHERTEELQRSNDDLRQFAHVASHDLKEPVRKIKTFNSRIVAEFSNELPEKVNAYVGKIGNAADRMLSMIEGVLAYSKIEDMGRQTELVDLDLVMTEIASDLELLIQQKNAKIVTKDLPALIGTRVLLHQLFYNLVLNSLKFARHNVSSVIDIRSRRIEQDGHAFFEIVLSDNGIGFEPAYAERIFTTFTRLNPADQYEGTGLGLALCKKIVLRHQGAISATGVPEKGAVFTILLPAS